MSTGLEQFVDAKIGELLEGLTDGLQQDAPKQTAYLASNYRPTTQGQEEALLTGQPRSFAGAAEARARQKIEGERIKQTYRLKQGDGVVGNAVAYGPDVHEGRYTSHEVPVTIERVVREESSK